MRIDVLNAAGSSTGRQVELSDDIFGVTPNDHTMYLAVKQYLASKRQGTSKTKERNEIAGSRKKLKRQKGTGTARFGDIKNPIFRGGGRIFGPKPRNYKSKVNKKVKTLARNSALSYKAQANNLIVLENISMDAPKTKEFVEVLNNLELTGKKVLLVLDENGANLGLSARNLKKATVRKAAELNTYDIMNANTLIISEGAVAQIV